LIYSRIAGTGSYLPAKIITNHELEKMVDTTDEWIRTRTGIERRHIAAEGETTVDLAEHAARRALEAAGIAPAEVDFIAFGTTTPDQVFPNCGTLLQQRLGCRGAPAFSVETACAGFMYALSIADKYVRFGEARRALVIGAETLSRITDWSDRATAVLFADGAGAVVIESVPRDRGLIGWDLGADGTLQSILYADHAGYLRMEGKEVFRRAVRAVVESARNAMERAKVTPDDIDLFVPHQANSRIIEAACSRLGIPMERAAVNLDHTGNTSSASVPMALVEAEAAGRLVDDQLVLLSGFGAGMTFASAVWRWGR
jgi:3-oxoacyl-[acyl-carrier-protein] synthase III